MKEKPRAVIYMRVGSTEPVKKAWIYERRNIFADGLLLDEQMKAFRKLCQDNGYTVLGETIIGGSSKETVPEIKNILYREKDLQYLLCPSIRSVSRHLNEIFETVDYLKEHGVTLKFQSGLALIEVPEALRNIPQELFELANHIEDEGTPSEIREIDEDNTITQSI